MMKHIETIKSIAVTLLFILMVVLAGFYIVNTQRLTVKGDSGAQLDSLLVIRGGDTENAGYDKTLVMPASVAFCENGRMYACLYDGNVMYDMYGVFSETLTLLLGPQSKAVLSENGEELCHGWITGFFPASNPRYAVTVLAEHGGYGNDSAAPIFKEIVDEMMNRK